SSSYERLICSEELGSRHQTPTLIGCIFLTNLQELQRWASFLANPAAISGAFDYRTVLEDLSTYRDLLFAVLLVVSDSLAAISEASNSIPDFESQSKFLRLLFPLCLLRRTSRRN
ncbi:hypothetical protein, partial [Ramlibacter sp.]|uniref:hypothetical protein n=1 Tax=Ramlibacter sp. TaxID=1917967 RepID=UPI002629DBC1